MKKLLLVLISLLFSANLIAATPFTAGKDYHVIKTNLLEQKQAVGKSKRISVVEFFNYGCPGCNFAEPAVEVWLKTKPAYIDFSRVPLTFEEGWETYAKAYYLATALGIERKITPALFLAIHGKDGRQYHDLSSTDAIVNFFVKHGVKRSIANANLAGNSATMKLQLRQGPELMKEYGVIETPTFVIAGKYRVSMGDAKSSRRLMKIVTYLAKHAHQE